MLLIIFKTPAATLSPSLRHITQRTAPNRQHKPRSFIIKMDFLLLVLLHQHWLLWLLAFQCRRNIQLRGPLGFTLTVYVSAGQPVNAHQSEHSVTYRGYLQERCSRHRGQRPDARFHFVQLLHVLAMTSLPLKLDPKPSDAVSSTLPSIF